MKIQHLPTENTQFVFVINYKDNVLKGSFYVVIDLNLLGFQNSGSGQLMSRVVNFITSMALIPKINKWFQISYIIKGLLEVGIVIFYISVLCWQRHLLIEKKHFQNILEASNVI